MRRSLFNRIFVRLVLFVGLIVTLSVVTGCVQSSGLVWAQNSPIIQAEPFPQVEVRLGARGE